MPEESRFRILVSLLFFFSGLTSLVYEITWSRILCTIVGNTALAVSLIVGIFMAGLAIGSFLAARLRLKARPILLYGCLEGFIGLYSLLTPGIAVWIDRIYGNAYAITADDFLRSVLLKAGLAAVLLLLPTLAMGATLPVLLRVFRAEERKAGAGRLYGINTAGAVAGTLLAGYFLMPVLGISGTIHLNAAVNGLLLLGSVALSRTGKEAPPPEIRIAPFHPLYLLPLLTGFATLSYEILWTRALSMFFGSSVYAFSAILAAFLLGIASGSSYYAKRIPDDAEPHQFFSLIQFRLALSAVFFIGIFMGIPVILILLFRVLHGSFLLYQTGQFLLIGIVVFYTTFLSGAAFPASLHYFRSRPHELQAHAGYVYGYNTLGSILGSFCAGFVMIPLFGVERSIRIVILVNLILGFYCFRHSKSSNYRILAIGGVAVLLLLVLPRWNQSIYNAGFYAFAYKYVPSAERQGESSLFPLPDLSLEAEAAAQTREVSKAPKPGELDLVYYAEGWTANVAVSEDAAGVRSLLINGKPDASNVPTGDMRTQLLLGHLPMALVDHAEDALVIGLGSGVTAGALWTHGLRRIDAVEIEARVVEASEYFRDENLGILKKPNFHLILDDARNVVRHRQTQYDVITSEPSNLWMSGVANLFTHEFFESTRKRLRPGGLMCQWLHLYQISSHDVLIFLKTIHSVYPYLGVWIDDSDMLVIGSDRPVVLDRGRVAARFSAPAVRDSLGRSGINSSTVFERYVTDERIVKLLRSTLPVNTDDHPVLEFSAPRSLFLNQSKEITRALYEMWRMANEP